jgi:hypothetical protein
MTKSSGERYGAYSNVHAEGHHKALVNGSTGRGKRKWMVFGNANRPEGGAGVGVWI